MKHVKNAEHRIIIGFIELLNDMGLNIVAIDNSFYAFTSFECANDILDDIELKGRNVTFLIENETATAASTILKKNELITRIDEIKLYRRRFDRDANYVQYLAN
jgi:hypothetical protein